jgi:hypothetical protein
MKAFLLVALAIGSVGCANQDPYQDPTYVLQRDLYHRNQKWDAYQNRQYMRRQAQDERYGAWFNSVME